MRYTFCSMPKPVLTKRDLAELFRSAKIPKETSGRLVDLYLWYGVFGIEVGVGEVRYVYDFNYSSSMLAKVAEAKGAMVRYWINPSFRSALSVSNSNRNGEPRLL